MTEITHDREFFRMVRVMYVCREQCFGVTKGKLHLIVQKVEDTPTTRFGHLREQVVGTVDDLERKKIYVGILCR